MFNFCEYKTHNMILAEITIGTCIHVIYTYSKQKEKYFKQCSNHSVMNLNGK